MNGGPVGCVEQVLAQSRVPLSPIPRHPVAADPAGAAVDGGALAGLDEGKPLKHGPGRVAVGELSTVVGVSYWCVRAGSSASVTPGSVVMRHASSGMVLDVAIESADHDSRLMPSPAPAGSDDDAMVRYSVLSPRAIWWTAGLIVLVGLGMAVWLLLAFGEGGNQARNQLEAIKTAGTIVIGTGGAAALLLAARRQRTAEIALKQKDRDHVDAARAHALQERIAATTEADAAARRVTELYTTATAQLGSDKAPVRLAGLYALERLAQDNSSQRQTIVNVL